MARYEPACGLRVGLLLTLATLLPPLAAQPPLLAPGPFTRGLWHLDEGQGLRSFDSGASGLEALLEMGAAWVPTPWGMGVAVTGAGQTLTIADPRGLLEMTGPFTLELWVRLDSLAGSIIPVLGRAAVPGGSAYELRFMTFPAGWAFKYLDPLGTPQVLFGRASVKVGEWHHVAVVWDGQTTRLYQDTVLLSSLPTAGFLGANRALPWKVGPGEHGSALLGAVDELHLASQALPPSFFRAGQTAYGTGKPGSHGVLPLLRQVGGPPAGGSTSLAMELDQGYPNMPGLLFLSPAPALAGVQGGWILVSTQGLVTLPVRFDGGIAGLPGTGRALVPLPSPGPAFLGRVLCCQALLADQGALGGFSLTGGLALWFPY